MSCQLDGHTLTVRVGSIDDSVEQAGVEYDEWEDGQYKRKVKALGYIYRCRFTAMEDTSVIAWGGSPAYLLRPKVKSGEAVQFSLAYPHHSFNGTVYIRRLRTWYSENMVERYYDLEVQEA